MKQFIEDVLHQQIELELYTDIDRLPLVFRGSYNFYLLTINGQSFILAEPKAEIGFAALRKQQRKIERLTGQFCVLYMKNLKSYPREKMIEEGIPFIWENHQIYMPFLGILLRENETRTLKPCTGISFLTQKLLLLALYNQWQSVTVTKAAEFMNIAKMSVSRCFDEIESLEIPVLQKKGRTRLLCCGTDKKEMWNLIKSYMRNPLLKEFNLEENLPQGLLKSGSTALCEYSMLNDNQYKTYAIGKPQLAEFDIKNKKQVPKGEVPGCVVQEIGYVINYRNLGMIDPLTLLMLMEKEREEPRVDKALEEMLEKYVW